MRGLPERGEGEPFVPLNVGGDVPESPGGGGGHWADRPVGRLVLGAILPLLLALAWWMGIRSGSAVVPTFGEVFEVLADPFRTSGDLYSRSLAFSTMMTLLRLALGFSLGVITAVPLGLVAGRNRVMDRVLEPLVHMARPVNPIVLLPIATVLFGISSLATLAVGDDNAWRYDVPDQVQIAMILILWWGAFFPIYISTLHGVRSVRRSHLEMMRLMGAGDRHVFTKVLLPHALPSIANGMRIAMGVTWLVLIAAEVFPGTRSGLGFMLCVACKTSDYQYTFAAIIVIAVVAYAMDMGLHALETRLGHWRASER